MEVWRDRNEASWLGITISHSPKSNSYGLMVRIFFAGGIETHSVQVTYDRVDLSGV